jgi:DNA-binding SARP family transcriptional activator
VGPPLLRIRLLGELSLDLGDAPAPLLESARAESLLAYLVLHREAAQSRRHHAFLLWPDSTEQQARTNLRHVLHNLRRALPQADARLAVTARTLRWRPDAPMWLDVAAFEDALDRGALSEAADLYTGELLQGAYDDWLLGERARLHERFVDALARLSAACMEQGDHVGAIGHAERLLRADPLREETYRLLMRLHDARGDRARALRVYHACAAVLERELGVTPAPATRDAYEALLPSAAPSGGGTRAKPPVLIGRSAERRRLSELWRESESGRATLVLVTGEAGIGKSRLVVELAAWCGHRGVAVAEARSYAAEGGLAFGPIVTWLRSEALAPRRVRLDRGRLAELARVLPELPGTPLPLPPDEQRLRLFDAMGRALLAAATPVLLVADDLQWAGRETLQFLHYLLRSHRDARLLVAATARTEDTGFLQELVAALRGLERIAEIELGPLSRRETAVLAERVAHTAPDEREVDRLFAETGGNPLFVVETLRAGSASPRVQAVIDERLAQLSEPARRIARVAAAVGQEFDAGLLAPASELDEAALMRALDELWRRRIVREHDPDGYDFTHDRIREVAYDGFEPFERRRAHLRIARALAAGHAHDPAHIALQFDRAGAIDDAVDWYERAAERALRMLAHDEAARLLERALALAPDTERRHRLTTALMAPLSLVEGMSGERLAHAQERGLALARELGVEPAPPLLRALALTRLSASDFEGARRYGEQLRARAEREGDEVQLVESHYALGVAAFWSASLPAARRHFEAAIAGYRPEHRTTHLTRYSLDPQVICTSRLANTLWFLGDSQAAMGAREQALVLGERIVHPPSLGTALVFATMLAVDAGDTDGVRRYASALAEWSDADIWRANAIAKEAFLGYVDVLDGRHARGLARIRWAVEESRATSPAPGHHAANVHVLIEACALAGDVDAGLEAAAIPVSTPLWQPRTRELTARFAEERSRNASAAIVSGHDR